MLISRLKEICVASLCRCVSTGTMEKERHLVKHLQKLSLLRPSNNLERWTMDDELQAKYLREGIQFCSRLEIFVLQKSPSTHVDFCTSSKNAEYYARRFGG